MSWLSEWLNPPNPQDAVNAQKTANAQAQAAAQAKADKDKADAAAADQLFRTNASGAAKNSANSYFQNLGLDPSQYSGDIDTKIQEILGLAPPGSKDVGSQLSGLGESIYNTRQNAAQQQALRGVNSTFVPDFERSKITDTSDQPLLSDINTEQRGKADNYIDNLFKRGVINQTGVQGAEKNLDTQGARVRTTLDDLGRGVISSGRQSLTDIANRGRANASTLQLGQTFDPSTYGAQADTATNDWLSKLGDNIRSRIPSNLYDTSNLASVAGGAQGAQNLAFDPSALAGKAVPGQTDDDPFAGLAKRAVF
jgi:hypothetical protein